RGGILRKFYFYQVGNAAPEYYCQRGSSSILDCFFMDGTPAVLNDLPFFWEDREDCMTVDNSKIVPDNSGCLFALFFQPSNQKLVGGDAEYEVRFEYDSLWLGQQTIVVNPFVDFLTKASYQAAARVVISDFRINGDTVS